MSCHVLTLIPHLHQTTDRRQVANEVVLRHFRHYKNMLKDEVHVRIVGHDIVLSLRTLRQVGRWGR